MGKVIDINDSDMIGKYDIFQYDDFLELSKLFEEFIFKIPPEVWAGIVENLDNTLQRCDEIDYQGNEVAIAYSLWHFLDRYHRMQIMCKYLLENDYINQSGKYDVLDVGTGPSQVLFALSDHFLNLNRIAGKELCTLEPDYVEQSEGFRNFLHCFVEFSLLKNKRYVVPFHHGRTYNAFDMEFNELRFMPGSKSVKYFYDITVFNNFLTTKSFVEKFADKLREICKYTRDKGLVIIIGAGEKSKKYQEIYPVIDDIILKPAREWGFYCRWNKVFDQVFNYRYDDKYGEIIGNYFKKVIQHLQEINLWAKVSHDARKEFLDNSEI